MTATELECRVSWVNAALRFYGRQLNHLHIIKDYANQAENAKRQLVAWARSREIK